MLTKKKITRTLQRNHSHLAQEYGIKRIGLFGSYANDTFNEASDIDLVVEFKQPIGFRFVELSEYLEKLLGKPVDLFTPAGIQNIRINRVANSLKENIVNI